LFLHRTYSALFSVVNRGYIFFGVHANVCSVFEVII
jgi:hypothetical protein